MKKAIIILMFLTSCGPSREELEQRENKTGQAKKVQVYSSTSIGINVIIVDKCEYIYCQSYHGVSIIHKQNCKNHK